MDTQMFLSLYPALQELRDTSPVQRQIRNPHCLYSIVRRMFIFTLAMVSSNHWLFFPDQVTGPSRCGSGWLKWHYTGQSFQKKVWYYLGFSLEKLKGLEEVEDCRNVKRRMLDTHRRQMKKQRVKVTWSFCILWVESRWQATGLCW